ncbi:MAG: hypothetical protein JNM85_01325 [Chthonomonas sp.]|nr:hypothetical protein [Chthonomonas sp.]
MGVSVSVAAVQQRLSLESAEYVSEINGLISAWVPVLNYAIEPVYVADTGNSGLQSTLNLAALELVTADMLAVLIRVPGLFDGMNVGALQVTAKDLHDDVRAMREQGWARLSPFLRADPEFARTAAVLMAKDKQGAVAP